MSRHKNKLVRRLYKGREDELANKPAAEINEEAMRVLRRSKRTWQKGITFICDKCKQPVSLWVNKEHEKIYEDERFGKHYVCAPCRNHRSFASILLEKGVEPWWKYNKEKAKIEAMKREAMNEKSA